MQFFSALSISCRIWRYRCGLIAAFLANRDYTATKNILARELRLLSVIVLIISGCSSIERSEEQKLRRRNCTGEYIHRRHSESHWKIEPPSLVPRSPYPWEIQVAPITKEFFRCKGSSTNLPLTGIGDSAPRTDCEGSLRHGLPILRGQQNVYPVLIELLNHVQQVTGKRVIITSGHRCPVHNMYVDPSKENRLSKHQIGAAVDFYVQGMERQPMEIIRILIEYYQKNLRWADQKEMVEFQCSEKSNVCDVGKSWFNKEIFIQHYSASEGRNGDNRHLFPYISIQVRYDRNSGERVVYDWKRANLGYPRDANSG
jgi:hypothetical protein